MNPNITICPKELEKIWFFVDTCNKEISGLGRVTRSGNTLHVSKIYLLKQECSDVETELDDDAIADLLVDSRKDKGELLFWWHSHVNMATFWSGTDMTTIEQLGKHGMILSTVFNKKREHRTSLYIAGDEEGLRPSVFLDQLDLRPSSLSAQEKADLLAEYKEKVTFPVPAARFPTMGVNEVGTKYNKYFYDDDFDYRHDMNTYPINTVSKTATAELMLEWNKLTHRDKFDLYSAYHDFWDLNGVPTYKAFKKLEANKDELDELLYFCEQCDFDADNLEEA